MSAPQPVFADPVSLCRFTAGKEDLMQVSWLTTYGPEAAFPVAQWHNSAPKQIAYSGGTAQASHLFPS